MRRLAFVFPLLVAACSSSSSSNPSNPDASPNDAIASTACPATQPADGTSCTPTGLACEYGGNGPDLDCAIVTRCRIVTNGASPTWKSDGAQCKPTPASNPAGCPAAYGASSSCPIQDGVCAYDQGTCRCTSCGEAGGSIGSQWSCAPFVTAPTDCPTPRPRLGDACDTEGKECDYAGNCCGSTTSIGPDMICEDGAWQEVPGVGCDCALPSCGP